MVGGRQMTDSTPASLSKSDVWEVRGSTENPGKCEKCPSRKVKNWGHMPILWLSLGPCGGRGGTFPRGQNAEQQSQHMCPQGGCREQGCGHEPLRLGSEGRTHLERESIA